MKKYSFKGILCLPVTPFTKEDEIDDDRHGEFELAVHKNPLVGNKDILEEKPGDKNP